MPMPLVQVYGNDYEAFKAYAATHKNCVFLVDTYDTLRIGVPAAIQVARELGDQINFMGVRIDSGEYCLHFQESSSAIGRGWIYRG